MYVLGLMFTVWDEAFWNIRCRSTQAALWKEDSGTRGWEKSCSGSIGVLQSYFAPTQNSYLCMLLIYVCSERGIIFWPKLKILLPILMDKCRNQRISMSKNWKHLKPRWGVFSISIYFSFKILNSNNSKSLI